MKTLKLIGKDDLQSHEIRESDIDMDFFKIIERAGLSESTLGRIVVLDGGEFGGKALCLSNKFHYAVGFDSNDITILVPLKKKTDCCK